MDFDAFIGQGWDDHVKDASGVAARLQTDGIALLSEARQIVPLAHLAHHVMGEHLGRWQDGLQFQRQLAALPLCQPGSAEALALRRFIASLQLASGTAAPANVQADERAAMSASDAIRPSACERTSLVGKRKQHGGTKVPPCCFYFGANSVASMQPQLFFLLLGSGGGCFGGGHCFGSSLFQIDQRAKPADLRGNCELVGLVGGLAEAAFILLQLNCVFPAAFFFAISFGTGHCETLFWSGDSVGLGRW